MNLVDRLRSAADPRSVLSVSQPRNEKSGSRGTPVIGRPFGGISRATATPGDSGMAGLFSFWLFTQCFLYSELGFPFTLPVGINITPDRILFGVILVAFLNRRAASKTLSMPMTALEYLMVLFAFAATISWVTGGSDEVNTKFRWLSTLFSLCYQPFAAYYIARRLPYDRSMVKRVLYALCAIGMYLGLTGIFEHFGIRSLVFPKYILDPTVGDQFGRARGPFAASVVNGGALLVAFLSLVCVWAAVKKRFRVLLMVVPVCITIYFTDTRGIWVGFIGIVCLFAVTRSSLRKPALTIIAFGMAVFVSGIFSKFSLYETTLFSRRQETVDYRYANYEAELEMFKQNPVLGIGYGNFNRKWPEYFSEGAFGITKLDDGNNTTLLGILAEMGIVGITLYMGILAIAAIVCISAYRKLKSDELAFERNFVIATGGCLQVFLLMGITTDLRFHPFLNVALFLFLGIVSSINAASVSLGSGEDGRIGRRFANGPSSKIMSKLPMVLPLS